ncbi:MAG: putative metal-binding motif-containing protein [Myxococcaceae bacterium]|nr:putative metal-binding motif-containing protein [Myxococcaceae bacterium]
MLPHLRVPLALRLLAAATVALCASCGGPGSVLVTVQVDPAVKATCVELQLVQGITILKSVQLPRGAGDDSFKVLVGRGSFPETVSFRARAAVGAAGCDGVLKTNGLSSAVDTTFPASGLTRIEVALTPPGADEDQDRDGYVAAAKNGPDCDDADVATHPGGTQRCDGSATDGDCNGKVGCADTTCATAAVCRGQPPVALAFETPARTASVGSCSAAIGLALRDASGSNTTASPAVNVTLAVAPMLADLFLDAACTQPAGTLALTGTAQLYFKGTTAGTFTLTASASGLTSATQDETVGGPGIAALAFTTPARTLSVDDACSSALTLETRDANGAPFDVTQATPITLTGPAAAKLTVFSDAACATPAPGGLLTLAAGGHQLSFFVRAGGVGVHALVAATAGKLATQDLTVTAGQPAALAFVTNPQALPLGTCSGPLTVQLQDQRGNPVAQAAALDVALSAAPDAGIRLASAAGCATAVDHVTIPSGQAEASFHAQGSAPANVTLLASVTVDGGVLSASQPFSIGAGPVDHLVFTTPARTIAAGGCSGDVTVELRDVSDNPASLPDGGTLALSGTGFSFSTSSACTSPSGAVALAPSTSGVTLHFTGIQAGTRPFTADLGLGLSASQAGTITALPASSVRFVSPMLTARTGTCAGPLRLEASDLYGNPSPSDAGIALSTAALGPAFHAAAGCATPAVSGVTFAGDAGAFFFVQGSNSGRFALQAAAFASTDTQDVDLVQGSATGLRFVAAPLPGVAGGCSETLEVEAFDDAGLAVAGAGAVALSAPPDAAVQFASACDAGALSQVGFDGGSARASFVVRSTVAGTHQLLASAAFGQTSASYAVAAGPTASLALLGGPVTVQASRTAPGPAVCSSALTAVRRDAFGNLVTQGAASAALSGPVGSNLEFRTGGCNGANQPTASFANGNSTSAAFTVRGDTAGTFTLTATLSGATATTKVTVTPGAPASVAVSPADPVAALQCSGLLRVSLVDAFGNVTDAGGALALSAPGCAFSASTDSSCSAPIPGVTVPAGSTSASARLTCADAGSVLVTASGTDVSGNATQTVLPALTARLALDAGQGLVTVASTTGPLLLAGECRPVTVERQDALGRPTSPAGSLAFALSAGTTPNVTFYSDATCTTPAGGGTIAGGSSGAELFVRALTGGTSEVGTLPLAADAGGGLGARQDTFVRNAVQRVGCTLNNGATLVRCPLTTTAGLSRPALLGRTLLVAQTTSGQAAPQDSEVVCELTADGGSTLEAVCGRLGNNGAVDLSLQTATWPSTAAQGGATVQHVTGAKAAGTQYPLLFPTRGVAQGQSLVLFQRAVAGGSVNNNDFFSATLGPDGGVEVEGGAATSLSQNGVFNLQVVELAGASVDHVHSNAGNADQYAVTGLGAVDLQRTFVLETHRGGTAGGSADQLCAVMARASLPDTTSVRWNRTNGNGGCAGTTTDAVDWQRAQLAAGNTVAAVNVTFGNGAATSPVPVSLDLSRTFLLTSSQAAGGPSGMETADNGATLGDAQVVIDCNAAAGTCTATRGSTGASATATVYAVQLDPR